MGFGVLDLCVLLWVWWWLLLVLDGIVLGVWIWVGLCICGVVDFVDCVLRWVCVCFFVGLVLFAVFVLFV